MRIALFTDVHHNDRDIAKRHCVRAIPLLRDIFARFANPPERPDMVVTLGDLIMGEQPHRATPEECRQADAMRLDEVLTCFAQSGIPATHHVHGNHEDKNLSRPMVAAIAARHGTSFASRVVDVGGVSLVLWSPNTRIALETNGAQAVNDDDLAWLETTLDRVSNPAIVLTHLPLDGDLTDFQHSAIDGRQNPVFGTRVIPADYYATHFPNAPAIREIISGSGKVAACLAGHTHWNEARLHDDVAYITIPSLVENEGGAPYGGWAMLDIDSPNKVISVNVHGVAPCRYMIGLTNADKTLKVQRLSLLQKTVIPSRFAV